MKIEIKNIKHSEFASQETNCFQATVYVDGKKSFGVENDGHGACDNYYPLKGQNPKHPYEAVAIINAELGKETIHTKFDGFDMKNNLEIVIGDLLVDWLRKKDAKKLLKKIAYIASDGKIYTLPARQKPTQENLVQLQKCGWWGKRGERLLNLMTIEEVMDLTS